jgi:hypothetical protein
MHISVSTAERKRNKDSSRVSQRFLNVGNNFEKI